MRRKVDEENIDEAVSQAYRAWTATGIPSDIVALFSDPALEEPPSALSPDSAIFFHLVRALKLFSQQPPHTLPLTSTLPDMKSDTKSYIHLQTLYKQRADEEKQLFRSFIGQELAIEDEAVDEFVKNAHALRLLRGRQFGTLDTDQKALGGYYPQGPFILTSNSLRSPSLACLAQGSRHAPCLISPFCSRLCYFGETDRKGIHHAWTRGMG